MFGPPNLFFRGQDKTSAFPAYTTCICFSETAQGKWCLCYCCTGNKIEDENHFLLDCKAYSQIRDTFFSKLETKMPDFKSLSHDTLTSLLMNTSLSFIYLAML